MGSSIRPALGLLSGTACPSPRSAAQRFSLHSTSLSPRCRCRGRPSQIGCLARSLEEALVVVASAHQPPPSQVLGSRVWDAWVTSPTGSSRGLQLRDPDAALGRAAAPRLPTEPVRPRSVPCPRPWAVPIALLSLHREQHSWDQAPRSAPRAPSEQGVCSRCPGTRAGTNTDPDLLHCRDYPSDWCLAASGWHFN